MLYNEDCLETMSRIDDKSVDLIIADPPYYKTYGEFDFVFETEKEYMDWTQKWVAESFRILKDDGGFYLWCIQPMLDKISYEVLSKYDWTKRDLIVWYYKTGRPEKQAFRKETEFLWFYSKKDHYINIDDVRIPYTSGGNEKDKRKNPKGKTLGNVWECKRIMPNYPEWVNHPTQKPLELCKRIILASSNEGELVYIPFAGSGSEIESCIIHGRNWIASEISSEYCKNIIEPRIGKYR